MRIAQVIYEISNVGGILQHAETLGKTFKDLGHSCDLIQLSVSENPKSMNPRVKTVEGNLGCRFNVYHGWYFPASNRIYQGDHEKINSILSSYDLVVWQIIVPTKNRGSAMLDWRKNYDNSAVNVGFIHDGNCNMPWFLEVADKFNEVFAVHEQAVTANQCLNIPITQLNNPHSIPKNFKPKPTEKRDTDFLSFQIFKAWKNVGDTLQSFCTYRDLGGRMGGLELAGGGIEQCYMTSETKMKSKYVYNGEPLWKEARKRGMKYLGIINQNRVFSGMRNAKFFVDASWGRGWGEKGQVYNRTYVEACKTGCIPMARVSNSSVLLKPWENVIPIPDPEYETKNFANTLFELEDMLSDRDTLGSIQMNCFNTAKKFNRFRIARKLLEVMSSTSKISPVVAKGKIAKEIESTCTEHFLFEPRSI